jgi:glycerol 3-phosphatase-1
LLGKERSGARVTGKFLVIEDSPAGVRAGKAAGCAVLGLATTHSIGRVKGAGTDWLVKDLQSVKFLGYNENTGQISIEISNALESK